MAPMAAPAALRWRAWARRCSGSLSGRAGWRNALTFGGKRSAARRRSAVPLPLRCSVVLRTPDVVAEFGVACLAATPNSVRRSFIGGVQASAL
jgi:hypothetical protein